MLDNQQITIQPIVSYPRNVEIGKTYLLTVDLQTILEDTDWPYIEEEFSIYCLMESDFFSYESIGEPVIVLNRFGGTYGPASFLIKANSEKLAASIHIKFINCQGLYLSRIKLTEIKIVKEIIIQKEEIRELSDHIREQIKKPKQKVLKTEENRYLDFVITKNEKLTFQGFETTVKAPILLWDVYVPLRANVAGLGIRDIGLGEREGFQERRDLSVEEAVQLATDKNYNGLIILGDPGAGKTTLLRYFLLCFAKKEAAKRLNLPGDLLPILLPLRSVDMNKTFIQNLCAQFQDYDLKLSEAFFLDRLEKGRAIVLLDGLDEVADETARKAMCQWIDNARTRFPRCPFIVTSRFAGYREEVRLPGAYLELHMLDFSKKDIRQFLHSWYTTVETTLHEDNIYWRTEAKKSAEELYNRIVVSEAYLKLAINPLMLQLIALVHYDYKTVPDRRVELYEKCTDLLLQKWDEAKGLKTLLSAKEARQVLQPLALWMHSVENRRQAEEQDVLAQITPHIQQVKPGVEPKKFLTSMRDRSGVFVGYGTAIYGFQHLSFQEYLTAEEIRNKSKVEILVDHFDESWWREPTLLALGLGNPSIFEPFIANFLRSDKNNGAAADFMLRCVRETLVKSEKEIVAVLHNSKFRWQARYNALLCLEAIGSDVARNAVEKVKADDVPQIARKAQEVLLAWGRLKEEEIAERDPATGWLKRFINLIEDNAEYILIPAGSYTMGELKKKVSVKPFYLAKFPVTNQRYRKFVNDTKHRKPEYWDDKKFNADDQPVVGVSWDDAVAYCKWLTKNNPQKYNFRLPTEAEWEWAAGRGERKYPWGNEKPDHNRANYDNKGGGPKQVGIFPAGSTPDGLMDLAGNVWELCSDWYDKNHNSRCIKGGSFDSNPFQICCSYRGGIDSNERNLSVGFRLVLSTDSDFQISLKDEISKIIKTIEENDGESTVIKHKLMERLAELNQQLAKEKLSEWIGNPIAFEEWESAVQILKELDIEAARSALIKALENPESGLRWNAVTRLAEIANAEIWKILRHSFLEEPDVELKNYILQILSEDNLNKSFIIDHLTNQFITNIDVSKNQLAQVEDTIDKLHKNLSSINELKSIYDKLILYGSLARGTAISPIADLDIFAVFHPEPYQLNPRNAFEILKTSLEKVYRSNILKDSNKIARFRSFGASILIEFYDAIRLEITPAYEAEQSKIFIPDTRLQRWLLSNHEKHTEFTNELNNRTNGRYIDLLKIIKYWQYHPHKKRFFHSFVLECLIAENFIFEVLPLLDLFELILKRIQKSYNSFEKIRYVPELGVPGKTKSTGITQNRYKEFMDLIAKTLLVIKDAKKDDNVKAEIDCWIKIFGSKFPSLVY